MVLDVKKTRRDSDAKTRALDEVTKEATKRLNVDIPASLHTQLKTRAAQQGTTIRVLAKQVLETYLEE